ncbi:CGH_1_HP_G0093310.mRNA.1.CDS.1 [Saccharomyces cerevisiae]|nr:CGH_1_HP_G0093310.mRNA.1.CDS.1 [Saccharomyces cerevisiae]CAI6939461.1 CGH_1_HP_G0093310.mRNA.1.CDS.1 [Saccharomyces cerevisiae]
MTMPHRYMFLAVFTLLALINVASGATEACLPAGQRKSGMNINFYQYSLKDSSTYSNAAYMAYGYASKTKLGSVGGQTDISIDYNIPCVSSSGTFPCPQEDAYGNWGCRGKGRCSNSQAVSYWSTDLFGFYTTPTNITLEMTGYFLPPQTGSYTFSFATVDDSAILSVGGSIAFECCAQEQPPITSTNFTINGIKPWHGSLPDNIAGTVYMYAGFYYPMKIVYSNAVSWGTLPISVTLPDGTTVSDDFEGYVYTFDNNLSQSNCTIPDPSIHTTSTITTTTEPWTGTFTFTSTEMTTITGTNGVPTDETIIVVKTPTTASTIITTTEPWTGTFTSTSTEMTTVTGTNGLPTDETVIVVKTPTTAISSSLSSSSGQITSSITSSRPIITPFYPSNGTSVISSSVISSSDTSSLVTSSLVTSSLVTSSLVTSSLVTSSLVTSSLVTSSLVTSSLVTSSVISSSVTSSLVTSSPVISSSFISSSVISSTTTSTSIFSESSKSSVIPTSSSTSGSSESKTSSASSSSSSSSISSESPKSTYSSSSLPPVTSAATSQETASSLPPVTSVTTSQEITSSLPPVTSATTSQETASSLPPVTSATTSQETASSLPPATTTKTSEQTTLVTVTSCESHVCTESISSAIVSTATVTVSGVTTEYTTWCPISTTEITKQTTETTKQTKGTTEQTTETTKQTTVVTISSCESDICSKTASPAIVSTSTATINGVTTEYTTWCPISTTESRQQTTLVTVTSCESGVCSETASPAIVSTATATVNDVVTVYPTWRPQTTNEESVSSKMNSATSETTTNTGAAETTTSTGAAEAKTVVTSSISRFNHAETQTASATDVIGHSSSVVSVSETGNTKSLITSGLSTMSQQPRSTPASSIIGSSTASLEISTYVGIANGLLTNNGISVFISTVLLAIVW